jgi:hypothetical protein
LFVTYAARAGENAMVVPGVVGPFVAPREVAPAPGFFEQPEHPWVCEASKTVANRTRPTARRYKWGVAALRRSFAVPVIVLALVCSIRGAHANGRFPQAQAIESAAGGDGQTLFLRATFGVLVSRDAGKTWRWICERALGYEGTWDPPIAVTRDGRLWVGLERGLVSTLDGCTVERTNELEGEQVKDLTVDAKGDTLWVLTGAPDKRGAIWRRSPGVGASGRWERMGLMPEDINPMTLEVAPSRALRVYVTGQPYGTIRGGLFRSDDGGKTITSAKNELVRSGPLFIAAIDPKDPNRVLLRHLHATGSAVVVTTDSGKTFKEVLAMDSAMFGFAKSPDGLTYFAGSGLPEHGIYRSVDRGEHFERVSSHGVLCLHDVPGGRLFVCENPATLGGPAIALSTDRGRTVSPVASFADIQGPVACDASMAPDAAGALCAEAWPETRGQIVPRDGGIRDDDAGRRRGDAGDAAPSPARTSKCGCELVGTSDRSADLRWLSAGLVPLVAWGRRRRRRGSPRDQSGRSRTS